MFYLQLDVTIWVLRRPVASVKDTSILQLSFRIKRAEPGANLTFWRN